MCSAPVNMRVLTYSIVCLIENYVGANVKTIFLELYVFLLDLVLLEKCLCWELDVGMSFPSILSS